MGKYTQVKESSSEDLRRLTGMKRTTFNRMTKILTKAEAIKRAQGGKPNKLLIEDRLLMTIEYWREYRSYFYIAQFMGFQKALVTAISNESKIPLLNIKTLLYLAAKRFVKVTKMARLF